jgi:hypothetical protein
MSTRAIGAALGVRHPTVISDVGGQDLPPTPVTGLDGKTYTPPRRPIVDPAPEPEVIDAEIVDEPRMVTMPDRSREVAARAFEGWGADAASSGEVAGDLP